MDAAVFELWDALTDLGPHAITDALRLCQATLCRWLDAQNSFWLGMVQLAGPDPVDRDPAFRWRIRCAEVLHPELSSPERMKRGKKLLDDEPPPDAVAVMAGAGTFRAFNLRGGALDLDVAALEQTAFYDVFYRERGITDRLWVAFPVDADTESLMFIDTYQPGRVFQPDEVARAATALRGIKWFHRQLLLSHGIGFEGGPLTPAERRIVPDLLSGALEREIAERQGLTPATVHQYATRVYRKFGVAGRAEFMALWLGATA